jgi:hypothetical protein
VKALNEIITKAVDPLYEGAVAYLPEGVAIAALSALKQAGYVVVRSEPLVAVLDSLAEWSNQRGELHDGLTAVLQDLGVDVPTAPGSSWPDTRGDQ